MKPFVVAALYKFADLKDDYKIIKSHLKILLEPLDVRGTLILAKEGINGTVAGTRESIDKLKNFLASDNRFLGTEYKEAWADKNPFFRLKIKTKKEIVTLRQEKADPSIAVGDYVSGQEWNDLILNDDTVVIDVRNDYEVNIGSFKNAINPKTESFVEFPKFVTDNLLGAKDKNIAMFCTGGIRCEKASAYMKSVGFDKVYHLKGGILQYLEDMPKDKSLWQGHCFVFDQRVAVDHDLSYGQFDVCYGCRKPISDEDKKHPLYEQGVACPSCANSRTSEQKDRAGERHKQMMLAKKRGEAHMGKRV